MFRRVLLAVTLLTCLVAAPAAAHGGEGDTVKPANGSVLSSTPRQVVAVLDELPVGDVSVVLLADDGAVIAPAGDGVRTEGRTVVLEPPTLEPGTYLVRWEYGTASGATRVGGTTFSIGEVTAVGVATAESQLPDPRFGIAGLLVLVGGLVWFAVPRRRSAVVGGGVCLLGAFLSAPAWPLVALNAAVGLAAVSVAMLGQSTARRGLAVLLPLAGAAAALTASWGSSWLSGLLVLAGAGAAVVAGTCLRVAVSGRFAARSLLARVFVVFGLLGWLLVLPASVLLSGWSGVTVPLVIAGSVWLMASLVVAVAVVLGGRGAPAARGAGTVAAFLVVVSLASALPSVGGPSLEPLPESGLTPAAACIDPSNRLQTQLCLQARYGRLADEEGAKAALADLEQAVRSDGALRFYCHEASHAIGRSAFMATGSVAQAFADVYDVCDFGVFHGILEGSISDMDDDEFKAALPELCRDLASSNQVFFMQCNHGLGHAAARRANNDLNRGLAFCDVLRSDSRFDPATLEQALAACGTGVTMEWFATAGAVGEADGEAVSPAVDELRDACAEVAPEWRGACVDYVGNTLDTGRPVESLTEITAWCLAQEGVEVQCLQGVARAGSGVGLRYEDVVALCDSAGQFRESCLEYYLATQATTVEYDVEAVDRVCAVLTDADRGPDGVCTRMRPVVAEILGSGPKAGE